MGICCMAQETQILALYQPRGVRWGGRWEAGSKRRRYKKAFLSDPSKEIEGNNRMGKTRDIFKKIRDSKGTFMQIKVQ